MDWEERATLTIEEAARVLGISRKLAYRLARQGGLPAVRLGRRWVISRAALERLLELPQAERGSARPSGR